MKKVKRWRYYCDHCKKSGGSGFHMKKHEGGCTKNPNRTCGFCDVSGGFEADPKELLLIVKKGVNEIEKQLFDSLAMNNNIDKVSKRVVEELLDKTEGCPACTLAAIRQTEDSYYINFDYKKTKDQFWKNNPRDEPEYGHDYIGGIG